MVAFSTALSAVLFVLGQVALIYGMGVWSLVVFRHGGLHRLHLTSCAHQGFRALLWDLVFAISTTFCSCLTQPIMYQLNRVNQARRAVRFLAWCSVLRLTMLMGLVCCFLPLGPAKIELSILGAMLGVVLLWGNWVPSLLSFLSSSPLLSPSSVFIKRRTKAAISDAPGDAYQETKEMLKNYGWVFVLCSSLASVILHWGSFFQDLFVFVPPLVLAPLGALLGLVIPMDLIALLPIIWVLNQVGCPFTFLVPLVISLEATAKRTQALLFDYLAPNHQKAYKRGLWILLVWICAAFFAIQP